jgi:Tfp pilus assembly protein PilO
MGASNRLIVSILVVAALAVAFWVLALAPKREEADKLAGEVEQQQVALSEAQSKAAAAVAAKEAFPADYRQLVLLGKAVPDGDETSSLFVELNHIADHSRLEFQSIVLNSSGDAAPETAAPATPTPAPEAAPAAPEAGSSSSGAVPAAATIPPTEAAASVLPLGASIGAAGLGVMPYSLSFSGDFFHVADFIDGIDSLVGTDSQNVAVDGRLVTLDGFALSADPELGFPHLDANFAVTTYLTPPAQGITAGATPTEPAAAPASTEPSAEPESESESESVPASDAQ